MTEKLIFIIGSFLVTTFGVAMFRRWSLSRGLLDIPNERSSHTTPIPRGGGLIIVAVCAICFLVYAILRWDFSLWGYFVGAILIAVVSWFDDIGSVSRVARIIVHSLAALPVIFSVGYFQTVAFPPFGSTELGIFGALVTFLWIVWITNAYNFMDGIDGIAAMQAVVGGLGWALIGWLLQSDLLILIGAVVASSSLGFLLHNWQPAKIFMGDVGSAFLGFTFGVLPVIAVTKSSREFVSWLPLIGLALVATFLFDSVFTIIRRAFRGEAIWQAHREHLYQQLVQRGYSHAFVAIVYSLASSAIVALALIAVYRVI